jgi:hypothetical protein
MPVTDTPFKCSFSSNYNETNLRKWSGIWKLRFEILTDSAKKLT